ncbi:TetR/AcrR family transcriptional regulator C-terminal domain-containing protein [Kitasatospora sp. NPDC059812]|uniref:TetR/AcrR family transcriptional regulator C-terminal domain-containing protein n=1 Tax=Kitasatospora sp. NPDC059812 TaxID=3346958 RepID=UPI0036513F46
MPARSKDAPGTPWSRPERPRREQPALSRAQIVAEALAILDSDGIEALSMRKLGARLNAGATSMYTHVANKDELLALAVDEVFGKIWIPAVTDTNPADWRATVAECAGSVRQVILRHPWMVSVIGDLGLVYFGPNWMRLSEALLTFLEAAGFTPMEASDAMRALLGYVIGTASVEASWLSALARHGREEQGWMDELLPAIIEATRDFPRLHRLYTTDANGVTDGSRDSGFTNGIRLILDGIEATRQARPTS